jgi:hypothetical protein
MQCDVENSHLDFYDAHLQRFQLSIDMSIELKAAAYIRDLARHFKTEPTDTVELYFGYLKTQCQLRAI